MYLFLIYGIFGLYSFGDVLGTDLGHILPPTTNGYNPRNLPFQIPGGGQDLSYYPGPANNNPIVGFNPPILGNDGNWDVTEDEEVGSIVKRLFVRGDDEDLVSYQLERGQFPPDGSSLFEIDDNVVKIKKSLIGKVEKYFINIRARNENPPNLSTVSHIRVSVKPKRDKGNANERKPQKPFGPPLEAGFTIAPRRQAISPPFFVGILPGTTWRIPSNINVGDIVGDKITAIDTHRLTVTYNIEPTEFISINNDGILTVNQSLKDKIGTHPLKITASNGNASISEEVVIEVFDPNPQSASTHELPKYSTEKTHDPIKKPIIVITNNPYNTEKTYITLNGKESTASNSGGSTQSPKPSTPESNDEMGTTFIPIVVVLGLPCIAVLGFFIWRTRTGKQKAAAETKGSTVSYSEKGEVITTNSNTTSKSRKHSIYGIGDSLSNIFASLSLWHKRAEENKYEDDVENENIKNRKRSEVSNPVADKWEVRRHHIKILGILGEGCFGQVWKAEAVDFGGGSPMLVAVKTLKERAGEIEKRDLIQELKVLKGLGKHPNVVSLLGCCTEKDPLFVILEYMIGGKLQSYLRSSRTDTSYNNLHGASSSLTPRDLTIFAHQCARGMEFLASRGIIHRDLAARNILVGEEKICKVADFGFARDVANNHIYERKSDGRLPIRWMAPESLFDHIYTTKSDVWSFGVLLWEIVTLGSTPYPGLGASEVMKMVKEGKRLDKPEHCRREIYNIMYYCWNKDPVERPSFSDLIETLEGLLLSQVEYIQLDKFPEHNYYNFLSEEQTGELL